MDSGSISSVQFPYLPVNFDLTTPLTSMAERNQANEVVSTMQNNLLLSQWHIRSLKQQIDDMCLLRSNHNSVNQTLGLRLSVLTTSLHLLRRYQILVLRDIFNLHRYLGNHVPPHMWLTLNHHRIQVELEQEMQDPNIWEHQMEHDVQDS